MKLLFNTLISHISNLYLNNKDTDLVTNNGISYRYSSSVSLMNDRQGSMDVGEDEGNIRYYGANPNNYIYFNCDDYSNQSADTCEKWRIIGIIDGKVKIARADLLDTTMSWNDAGNNNWGNASLKTYLNGDYYKSLETKNADTLGLISNSTWYLGGWDTSSGLYANDIYIHERTDSESTISGDNPPSLETNIGLMYASDYGYATDFTTCLESDLYNYRNSGCYDNDWLFKEDTQWLITPDLDESGYAWTVAHNGTVLGSDLGGYVGSSFFVLPVLYLDSEIDIESEHEGTNTDPYRISVS